MKKQYTWTIGKRLWLLSGALLVVLVGAAGTALFNASTLVSSLVDVGDIQFPAVRSMTLADMMHDGIRANVFHAIMSSNSKDPKELEEIKAESEEFASNIKKHLDDIGKLQLDEGTRDAVKASLPEIEAYVASARDVVEVALAGKKEEATQMVPAFQEKFKSLEDKLEVLGERIEKNAQNTIEKAHVTSARASFVNWSILLIGLAFGLVFSTFLVRSIQKALTKVISELAKESVDVSETADVLSQSASQLSVATVQQASALQETAASVDEITAMVKKTSENCEQLEVTAQASNQSAARGGEAITEMLRSIDSISESNTRVVGEVEESNRRIAEIVKVIGEIGNKTKVINDIVFQTKLLSFNASVEAARAGEHGKGFAVVAEEVGNLAQMSGNAAKEISDMLGASIQRVESIAQETKTKIEALIQDGKSKLGSGKRVAAQCETALGEIVRQSSDVTAMITEITTAVREQNQGIQEISKALTQLDQTTHQNSSTSRSTSETSEGLLAQSKSLKGIVETLSGMAGIKLEAKSESRVTPESNEFTDVQHEESRAA